MSQQDLTALSDEDFGQLYFGVLNEQERRENLRRIPDQVFEFKQLYNAIGGDVADLVAALERQPAPTPPPVEEVPEQPEEELPEESEDGISDEI